MRIKAFDVRRGGETESPLQRFLLRNVTPTEWQTPTLLNSWVNYGFEWQQARFRREGNTVHIEGMIKSGTTTPSTVLFVLPDEYRPQNSLYFPCAISGGAGLISITASGQVRGEIVSAVWTSVTCSFQIA